MRIAIDGRELAGKPTGVGRYLAEILAGWARLPGARAHEFVLCVPDTAILPSQMPLPVTVRTAASGGTRWEQLALPRLLRQSAQEHGPIVEALIAVHASDATREEVRH
jgi:hypothetical protein